ncbi:MAG: methyltransferase [Acidobacteria bacterium]|nr:methyltransferase [Acidobacteriota bacterium]
MTSGNGDRFGSLVLFARNFLKHPSMLGWPLPSSRFLINELLKWVDWQKANVIVEYGPGVGSFTIEILKRMRSNSVLVAVETNEDFIRYLRRKLHDRRLHLIHGSATEICQLLNNLGYRKADYVITGIPFRTIPEELRQDIMRATLSVLQPHGSCLVYSFSSRVKPYLEGTFERVQRDFELLNFLPAKLWRCTHPRKS